MKSLKIKSLNKGYCDKDVLLLHANFQILKDFVEKECPETHNGNWAKKRHGKKCKELYDWWMKRKAKFDSLQGETYEDDTKKLIELIKIRAYLWT